MTNYEVDYSYKLEEYGEVILEAENVDDAEVKALSYVSDMFPDVTDIVIETVRELKPVEVNA